MAIRKPGIQAFHGIIEKEPSALFNLGLNTVRRNGS